MQWFDISVHCEMITTIKSVNTSVIWLPLWVCGENA